MYTNVLSQPLVGSVVVGRIERILYSCTNAMIKAGFWQVSTYYMQNYYNALIIFYLYLNIIPVVALHQSSVK